MKRFLAKVLGVPRWGIELVRGSSGRDKIVRIKGRTHQEVLDALSPYVGR